MFRHSTACTWTPPFGLKEQGNIPATNNPSTTYETSPTCLGHALGALAKKLAPVAPDLAIVLATWEFLPDPVKAAIAAIAKATPAVSIPSVPNPIP